MFGGNLKTALIVSYFWISSAMPWSRCARLRSDRRSAGRSPSPKVMHYAAITDEKRDERPRFHAV
jgi:hypothetical protein